MARRDLRKMRFLSGPSAMGSRAVFSDAARLAEVHKRGVRFRGRRGRRARGARRLRSPGSPGRAAAVFAGIPVRLGDETKHFKLLGTTGTGKSTAIGELLAGASGAATGWFSQTPMAAIAPILRSLPRRRRVEPVRGGR